MTKHYKYILIKFFYRILPYLIITNATRALRTDN